MPLFFFHIRDGVHLIPDPDGSCLPDLASAQTEAVLSARELMSHSIVSNGRLGIERCFEIADYEGKTAKRSRLCLLARPSDSTEGDTSDAELFALRCVWNIRHRCARVSLLRRKELRGR